LKRREGNKRISEFNKSRPRASNANIPRPAELKHVEQHEDVVEKDGTSAQPIDVESSITIERQLFGFGGSRVDVNNHFQMRP
jgi:hypothetical protein